MKCPKCNGKWYDRNSWSFICKFCHGKQELDWIDCVIGVDSNELINSPESCSLNVTNDNWYTYSEMSKM